MPGLSKSRIIAHRQCPKRLWLAVNRPDLTVEDAVATARFRIGNEVGEVARGLYPGGVLIETIDSRTALGATSKALSGPKKPIFEAAFAHEGVLVRADLLLADRGGHRMVEVKSSTKVHEYQIADAAIQAWVARKSGIALNRVEIAHVDSTFVYPGKGDYDGLFAFADVTAETAPLERQVPKWVKAARETLALKKEPKIEPGTQCTAPFECPFTGYCSPAADEDIFPPEILPFKHGKALAAKLRAEGYEDLRKVPGRRLENAQFKRIWRVSRKGGMELNPKAGETLVALSFPRYYIDFETFQPAVPVWAGTRPYQQTPYQWSCHIERKSGPLEHLEFLSHDGSDPRRPFAETLIKAVRARGPVFVYNASFEGGRLNESGEAFPDLAPALDAISARFVDLLPLARNHYYHRDMRGSWSIKAVLPTIAPELSYDGLGVADGAMAAEAFAEMLHPQTEPKRATEIRQALLEYCGRDTLAMVKIAHFFQGR